MILLHDAPVIESKVDQRLKESMIELANLLGYDIAKFIQLSENNSFAIINREYVKGSIEYSRNFKDNKIFLRNSKNYLLKLALENKQMIAYFKADKTENEYLPLLEGMQNELYIPLFLDGSISKVIIGYIYLAAFKDKRFDKFEDILNDEVKEIIIKISALCQILHFQTMGDERKFGALHVISEITKIREPYMINHPYRVAQWSRLIGQSMSLDEIRLYKLDTASIMHDIGKLYIDKDILNKTSRLNEEEFQLIKEHPTNSYIMVKDMFCFEDELKDVCEIVKYHHERFDGKGYPEGIKGEGIPLESRILCVADSVDAMMSPRSYKSPKSLDQTITELIAQKGKQFDPVVADIMVKILLKASNTKADVFSDSIIWGTLTIDTKESSYLAEGTLVENEIGYVFTSHSFNFSDSIEISEVTSMSLYIEKNRNIIEFDVKIEGIDNNNMYISQLTISPMTDAFSMLWYLSGLLYVENKTYEINIYKVGGSSLSFYIFDIEFETYIKEKILKLTINFDEETEITVTGKIVERFSVSNKNFYTFFYVNTPSNVKDKIFSRLFRKQIELMKLYTAEKS